MRNIPWPITPKTPQLPFMLAVESVLSYQQILMTPNISQEASILSMFCTEQQGDPLYIYVKTPGLCWFMTFWKD